MEPMLTLTSEFPIDQLGTFSAAQERFGRATGLVATLMMVETEGLGLTEVIEVTQQRSPNLALWWLRPAEGGLVELTAMPSGKSLVEASIVAALGWVMKVETGLSP